MSSQAAISIENARLYQQEIQQQLVTRELETAHAIQASFLPDSIPQYDAGTLGRCGVLSVTWRATSTILSA